jgi:hypothetical protein
MKPIAAKMLRCAIYTRVSTEHGLEQEFNSLHAQREAAQAYVKSQAHEGWKPVRDHYGVAFQDFVEACPPDDALAISARQPLLPYPHHLMGEPSQSSTVAANAVIGEVAPHH